MYVKCLIIATKLQHLSDTCKKYIIFLTDKDKKKVSANWNAAQPAETIGGKELNATSVRPVHGLP